MKKYGILLAFLAITSWANATIYYLKPNNAASTVWSNVSEPGNVVTDDIDAALEKLTAAYDELWIAGGTYTLQQFKTLSKQGVKIYGGFAGTEASLEERDANLLWTTNKTEVKLADDITVNNLAVIFVNAIDVVMDGLCFNGENKQHTVESAVNNDLNVGYVIVRFANNKTTFSLQNCRFEDFSFHFQYTGTDAKAKAPKMMGCVYLYNSQAKVDNCYFKGNKQTHTDASTGTVTGSDGGTAVYMGNGGSSDVGKAYRSTITNCVFDGNAMQATTCASLRCYGYVTVTGCEFKNHTNTYPNQYVLSVDNANTTVEQCVFHDNAVRCFNLKGGGTIERSLFYNNTNYPAFFTSGKFQNNAIMASNTNIGGYASNAATNTIQNNLWIGKQMATPTVGVKGPIDWSNNYWLLSKAYPTTKGDTVTVSSNTVITNGTQLVLSDYGPTVWPADAWAALKSALDAQSVTSTFALKDGKPFNYTGEGVSNPVSYTRSCYEDALGETIVLPFKPTKLVDEADNDASGKFKFEWFKEEAGSQLTFVETSFENLQANVPYLMYYIGETGSQANYTFKGDSLPARPESLGQTFVGTYETVTGQPADDSTTRYAYYVDDRGTPLFGKMASTTKVAPYRAYLELAMSDPSDAPVRFSVVHSTGEDQGGATTIEPARMVEGIWGIEGAMRVQTDAPQTIRIYALDGRLLRVEQVDGSATIAMPRGIYLVNQQKIVIQ